MAYWCEPEASLTTISITSLFDLHLPPVRAALCAPPALS